MGPHYPSKSAFAESPVSALSSTFLFLPSSSALLQNCKKAHTFGAERAPTGMLVVFSHHPSPLRPLLLSPSSSPPPPLLWKHATWLPGARPLASAKVRRSLKISVVSMGFETSEVAYDVAMSVVASGVALGLLRFWEEMAKRGVFQQVTNRKLVHISIGLAFMLFWPFFSSGAQAPYLAALAPGINIIRMLLMGLGVVKNEAMVKSISRGGDCRELLKGPLYYACTITLATIVFWRTSPIGFATICNLCAGDGVADIIGRKFGGEKLPHNRNKSFAGSIAMFAASFITSIMFMHYFSMFGLIEESWSIILGFLVMSLIAATVESLPISTELDDNLTVPLVSALVGCLVF